MEVVRGMAELQIARYWHGHNAGLRTRRQSINISWKEYTDRYPGLITMAQLLHMSIAVPLFLLFNSFSRANYQQLHVLFSSDVNCTGRLHLMYYQDCLWSRYFVDALLLPASCERTRQPEIPVPGCTDTRSKQLDFPVEPLPWPWRAVGQHI
jgi:hypothetical protein